jgi:hypothetical protein
MNRNIARGLGKLRGIGPLHNLDSVMFMIADLVVVKIILCGEANWFNAA